MFHIQSGFKGNKLLVSQPINLWKYATRLALEMKLLHLNKFFEVTLNRIKVTLSYKIKLLTKVYFYENEEKQIRETRNPQVIH